MTTRRVVVTGAAGFLGHHVASRLARSGWQVIGIGHGTLSLEQARSWGIDEWHAADLTFDALVNACAAPDAIIHCAGSGAVGYSLSHPFQDFHRSCASVAAALEYARLRSKPAPVVYLSSAAVYGQASALPTREDAPIAPASPYGFHKSLGETLCRMYGAHYGVPTAIVRLFSVYGTGLRKQLLWDACGKAKRGDLEFGGTGEETRDWLHVEDAAELICHMLHEAAPSCPVANGGTGEAPTVRAVLTALLRQLGVSHDPRFSGIGRPGDPKHFQADISTARGSGWTPRIDWRSGVAAYAHWYQSGQT